MNQGLIPFQAAERPCDPQPRPVHIRVIGAVWAGTLPLPSSHFTSGNTVTAEFFIKGQASPIGTLVIDDGLVIDTENARLGYAIKSSLTAQAAAQEPSRAWSFPTRLVVVAAVGGLRSYPAMQLFCPVDRRTVDQLPPETQNWIYPDGSWL